MDNDVKTENKEIRHLSNNEQQTNEMLGLLKRNEVTPICVQDIISDFQYL